jgi:hypothetical protein
VTLKDGVALPLVADLCRAARVAVPFGLLSLPSELRISIMELLPVRCMLLTSLLTPALQDCPTQDQKGQGSAGLRNLWTLWCPHLQFKDLARLTCVCAELREAGSANSLWRRLFEAEFGEASLAEATAGAHGWKALFGTRWLHREEYRSARRRPMRLPYMGAPPHPLLQLGRPPGTPFIIGSPAHADKSCIFLELFARVQLMQ